MKKNLILLTSVCILLFATNFAVAQEEEPKKEEDKKSITDNWSSQVEAGFSSYRGNVKQTNFRGGFGLTRKDDFIESSIYGKAVYSTSDAVTVNEEYEGGIALDYKPQNKFSPFMVFSAYRNEIKHFDLRLSAMAGAKWTFMDTETGKYSISGAFLFEKENYSIYKDENDVEIDNPDKNKKRISIRPKFTQKVGETTTISGIAFFKANVEDFDNDYQIESEIAITNKITDIINIKLSYEYDYDNTATGAVHKNDHVFIASLVLSF